MPTILVYQTKLLNVSYSTELKKNLYKGNLYMYILCYHNMYMKKSTTLQIEKEPDRKNKTVLTVSLVKYL